MFAVGKVTINQVSRDVFEALSNLLGIIPETTTCIYFFRLKNWQQNVPLVRL